MGNVHGLLAAVVNVGPISLKPAVCKIHPDAAGDIFQQDGGSIAPKGIAGKAGVAVAAAVGIVMGLFAVYVSVISGN